MTKNFLRNKLTGLSIPLGALYSKENPVIGEFEDLIPFSKFCKSSGIKIIQLLPVNDTGTQSSPYSGLSAFALNPIYIRIKNISGFNDLYSSDKEFSKLYDDFINSNSYTLRYDYDKILNTKISLLRYFYNATKETFSYSKDKNFLEWIKKNEWVKFYSVYKALKWKNMQASWKQWPDDDKNKTKDDIINLWDNATLKDEHLFYAWTQKIADEQFQNAVKAVHDEGILLKGDMPILMNEDSCDAWTYPEFFNHNLRAGSPSDFDNPGGQNWGFPTYNWKNLKEADYSWWKDRLKNASKYYDAYRLDHILGFFRIWAIPQDDCNALNGHTEPYSFIKKEELYEAGFDDDRIRWLSQSHIPTSAFQDFLSDLEKCHEILNLFCTQINQEELWLFKKTVKGSQFFWDTDLSEYADEETGNKIKAKLVEYWSNRTLLEITKNKFVPLWTYNSSTSWQSLSETEKKFLTDLFTKLNEKNEKLWQKQADDIFTNITSEIEMIPCGEDLGVGIDCVPSTMKKHNILGLQVVRWTRKWSEPEQPYIDFKEYRPLSVTTTSVHDSSTIREWYESENKDKEFTEETAFELLKKCSQSASIWYINPIQDYLYMNKKYWLKDAKDERINVPGTVTKFNWTYRLPVSIEDLNMDKKLIEKISQISTDFVSYNEFHISRNVRDLCDFNKGLFASSGNVVFANIKNVRDFQLLYNNYIETVTKDETKKVSAGQLNAMGLIDEILHHVCMLYRKNVSADFFKELLLQLNNEFTAEQVDSLLLDFIQEFPPVEVYKEKCTAQEYLERTAVEKETNQTRTNREQTLEEMILLYLANENPAFKPFLLLFSDKNLSKNKLYTKAKKFIGEYAKTKPSFGPFNHDLINLLKEPQVFAPDSLRGQLEYIQKYWDEFLGEWLKRILQGIDTISEEEKAMWHGFGGGNLPDMQAYSFENLMNEYERFSPDKEWMPNVILIAKTVLVWLDQLTKQYGYPITRLDQIPDAELDSLRDQGFTGLWLIGLWERSKASKRIKQICGNPEAAASAYSLFDYNIAQNIGGWDALANLRQRLWQRGIRLASDMVPNHTGMDGDWVINRPDLFIQRRDCPFPHYSFNGENLSQDGRISLYLEDHYYSKNDCSVVFKRVDNQTGDVRYIYHGNDGTGLPWNDTAQIDFLNPEAREAVMQEILHVAQNFPIIRFDAAMVLAKKSIRRLWYPEPGHGGDIATRSETGLNTQQFNDAIPNEFWREVVDRVAKECPDTLLLAEAFWMMEGYFVRTLGMHRVYNSAFMNMLKKEENQKYRDTVKNTINFDPQILKRYVNFMNNPDEETAIAQFGDGDKYFGVCTLMITMPGLPMFGHGQIEGYTEKYGMEYTKAYKDEKPNSYLVDRHWKEIFPLMKKRYLFSGVENFLFYDLWQDNFVNENVFAYSNGCGNERTFVVYNNKYDRAYGWIKNSNPFAVKTGNGDEIQLITKSISEGLNLHGEEDKYCIFRENRSNLWYIRKSREICEKGLFVMLNGFEYQVYMDVQEVTDEKDNRYKILCEYLNGKGCENIENTWQDILYKDLYASFNKYIEKTLPEILKIFEINQENNFELKYDKPVKKENYLTKLKNIILDSEKELDDFNNECSKVLGKEQKVSVLSKNIISRLTLLYKIHKEKSNTKITDLQKCLLKCTTNIKFTKLLEDSNKDLELQLILWALCGQYAENSIALKYNLARKFVEFLKQPELKNNLTKLFILSSVSDFKSYKTGIEYQIVSLLMQSKYNVLLSGVNNFDNIWWFNKELSDYSLNIIFALQNLFAKEKDIPENFALYKKLNAAKIKAAYKCDLFIKQFEPKKTAKKTVKTASKKVAKNSTKTVTKKSSVKKSKSQS